MTHTHLRESVSNWIVDDSCPAGQPCTNIFALPSSHNISQKSSLSDIFTPKESNIFDGLLGKRPLVDKKDCGVNPNAIFQVIKSYTDPLPKRPKLCESTDFLIFPELPAKEYEQIQTHDNEPTTIDSNVQNYPSPLSPDNSDENEQMQDELEELFEPYPLITDVKKQKVTSSLLLLYKLILSLLVPVILKFLLKFHLVN